MVFQEKLQFLTERDGQVGYPLKNAGCCRRPPDAAGGRRCLTVNLLFIVDKEVSPTAPVRHRQAPCPSVTVSHRRLRLLLGAFLPDRRSVNFHSRPSSATELTSPPLFVCILPCCFLFIYSLCVLFDQRILSTDEMLIEPVRERTFFIRCYR